MSRYMGRHITWAFFCFLTMGILALAGTALADEVDPLQGDTGRPAAAESQEQPEALSNDGAQSSATTSSESLPAQGAAEGAGNDTLAPADDEAQASGATNSLEATDAEPTATLAATSSDPISRLIDSMTLEEKIAQMIIPAIRTWNGAYVTDLVGLDDLREALRKHQFGGLILYGSNISSAEQTAQLVCDLQSNNAAIENASAHIPYFMAIDEEGGVVLRFTMGTRMTGNMAIGATGDDALDNAFATGMVLGKECAALGFNLNFAPDVDVNNNPANPIIGTRSFSDDPNVVGSLGKAFADGMAQNGVIATYKHFPGHGDTGTDTHIETSAVHKTFDQLNSCELVPFRSIAQSADMIMTAHVTLPNYDDQVLLADGVTMGNYPATMSKKVITDLLRNDIGYQGVVVTDALEMGAVSGGNLVAGANGSVEYGANVAQEVINAGCDLLLLPRDLTNQNASTYYDEYIADIAEKVTSGAIPQARIDESVRRILALKQKRGIWDPGTANPTFSVNLNAQKIVGSAAHHKVEKDIAQQAITLLKNDDLTLPLSGHEGKVVLLGRLATDANSIAFAVQDLQNQGIVDGNAYVHNLVTGATSGSEDAAMSITIDYYSNHYTDDLAAAIAEANTVVCFTATYSADTLAATSSLYQNVSRALAEAHAAGGTFVLLSNNLPYDAARYQDADAILLSYMASGLGFDPADIAAGTVAYNANVIAALEALFDNMPPTGMLPVQIPVVTENGDGSVSYGEEMLYQRQHRLTYQYAFVQGAGGTHEVGSGSDLAFKNNARFDKLVRFLVDGATLDAGNYVASVGSTNVTLKSTYLDTLAAGTHTLSAVYNYGQGEFAVDTTFAVKGQKGVTSTEPETKTASKATSKAKATTSKATATSSSGAKLAETGDHVPAAGWLALVAGALVACGAGMRRRRA